MGPVTNRIEQVFGIPRVFLPVIHPVNRETALESIRGVHAAGCRGIFLIDQGMQESGVLQLICEVRAQYPRLWIGVNLLRRSPAQALRNALTACDGRVDGIWADDAGIDVLHPQDIAAAVAMGRAARNTGCLYFGGVAFKYQRPVDDMHLPFTAALASEHMDVVCTSGPGTGQAPTVDKIAALSEGLVGDTALALASGVTVDNVQSFLPYVHAFLVGTGVEERLGVIDAGKVSALRAAIEGDA